MSADDNLRDALIEALWRDGILSGICQTMSTLPTSRLR